MAYNQAAGGHEKQAGQGQEHRDRILFHAFHRLASSMRMVMNRKNTVKST